MKKLKNLAKIIFVKYGAAIASCAFAFVAISANSSCGFPFYEPEEPAELDKYKKFNK